MTDTADLNLVLATILPKDALKNRARRHLSRHSDLVVTYPAGIELLFVAKRFGLGYVEVLGTAETHFSVENREVLYTAAEALDSRELTTVFDAIHTSEALHRGGSLHTADRKLLATAFPTTRF